MRRWDFTGSLFSCMSRNCRVAADGADAGGGTCPCCLPRGEAKAFQDDSKLSQCHPHDGALFLDGLLQGTARNVIPGLEVPGSSAEPARCKQTAGSEGEAGTSRLNARIQDKQRECLSLPNHNKNHLHPRGAPAWLARRPCQTDTQNPDTYKTDGIKTASS